MRHLIDDPVACQCGEVIKGLIKPWQCSLYGKTCNPQTPLGALMVSSEGACAAYYNNGFRVPEKEQGRIAVIEIQATEETNTDRETQAAVEPETGKRAEGQS